MTNTERKKVDVELVQEYWKPENYTLKQLSNKLLNANHSIEVLKGIPGSDFIKYTEYADISGGYYSIMYKRWETEKEYSARIAADIKAAEDDRTAKDYADFVAIVERAAAERPEFDRLLNKFGSAAHSRIINGVN
jgi:hypothetical protein